MAEIAVRTDFPRKVREIENTWIVLSDGCRLAARIWLPADAEQHPDLYWAVRGGGGNFGVVTSFEFQLHPMQRTVLGGGVIYPMSKAREVLETYASYSSVCPDELYTDLIIGYPPGAVTDL